MNAEHVFPTQVHHVDVGRSQGNAVPADQGFDLFIFFEIFRERGLLGRFKRLNVLAAIVNHLTAPRAEK